MNDKKYLILQIITFVFLFSIMIQNCKRGNQIEQVQSEFIVKIDSLQTVNKIEELNTNINYLKELQNLTNSITLKDKEILIESQNQKMELLNQRLNNLKLQNQKIRDENKKYKDDTK